MVCDDGARTLAVAITALLFIAGTTVAQAQDTSAWERAPHAAARLISGVMNQTSNGVWLRAGVEIRLEPGWHTYWRSPGDFGVPPTFDFGGSVNVKSVTVLWPAPERIADGAGYSNGYFDDVVFPLRIFAADITKPAILRMKLQYAVCAVYCLPAEAHLELSLSGKRGAEESTLVAAEGRVPRRVPLGVDVDICLSIRSVRLESGGGQERIVVDAAVPTGTPMNLFVEGPTPDWTLPSPEPMIPSAVASGMRQFAIDLNGLPADTQAVGARLTFTAVSASDAIEVRTRLNRVQTQH